MVSPKCQQCYKVYGEHYLECGHSCLLTEMYTCTLQDRHKVGTIWNVGTCTLQVQARWCFCHDPALYVRLNVYIYTHMYRHLCKELTGYGHARCVNVGQCYCLLPAEDVNILSTQLYLQIYVCMYIHCMSCKV